MKYEMSQKERIARGVVDERLPDLAKTKDGQPWHADFNQGLLVIDTVDMTDFLGLFGCCNDQNS